MSFVDETKLLPEERDSQIVWLNPSHDPSGRMSVSVKLMPNSANSPALRATPLIGLFAAVIGASVDATLREAPGQCYDVGSPARRDIASS